MIVSTNQQSMERFVVFINSADAALASGIVAEDAQFHVPFQSEPLIGPEGYMTVLGMMRSAFSDIQWDLLETVSEGDTTAARFVMRGTHDGSFFGVPATGNQIEANAMNFYRFRDGKIYEEIGQPDLLSIMRQIGAIPG